MKKRILFIYGPLGGGGAERVLIDVLRNFNFELYDVDLCVMLPGGVLWDEIPEQINIIKLWNAYTLYYKIALRLSNWLGIDYLFKRTLRKKIKSDYDVEISFLEGMPLKLHAMLSSESKKYTWVHCDLEKVPYEANQFRKGEEIVAYNTMDAVICVSDNARQAFKRRFMECIKPIYVIHNPIDYNKIIKLSNEYNVVKNKFTIITVGRLTRSKRIDRLLRLCRRFKNENIDVKFQIVGDGELKSELLRQRKRFGLENESEFLGFKKNPFPYVKAADLMVSCSDYEGFSLVICEAMSLGVPVVATKTAGPSEILGDNEFGVLCEHDDNSIYEAIVSMVKNKDKLAHYKQQALKKASSFSVEDTIKEIEKLM